MRSDLSHFSPPSRGLLWPLAVALFAAAGCRPTPGDAPAPGGRAPAAVDAEALRAAAPIIDKGPGKIKLRGTAEGGNATGAHECDSSGPYSHYEEPTPVGAPQLHLIGVYGPPPGSPDVAVEVARGGPSVLVLSSYEAAHWVVTAAPGAAVTRIIIYGYHPSTASAPPGTLVEIHSGETEEGSVPAAASSWPSYRAADLASRAEYETGRELTSFRGCAGGRSFRIDEAGPLAPPHATNPRAEPTLPTGCEAYASESAYCVTLHQGAVSAVGLDSGTVCHGPPAGVAGEVPEEAALGWGGEYVYECHRDRGVLRISVRDGSVDVAPVACDMVTTYGAGLLVAASLDTPRNPDFFTEYMFFDDFTSAAKRKPSFLPGVDNLQGAVAVEGDRVFLSWVAVTPDLPVDVATLPGFEPLLSYAPAGYDGNVRSFDALADGRLLLHDVVPGEAQTKISVFDATTGAAKGTVPLRTEGGATFVVLSGVDCTLHP